MSEFIGSVSEYSGFAGGYDGTVVLINGLDCGYNVSVGEYDCYVGAYVRYVVGNDSDVVESNGR